MKNILIFPIIFAFIFSACSDFTGNEDAVEASLKPTTAPILKEVTAVTTPTTDTTPNYTFSSSEAGTITYGGSCSSSEKNAKSGNNTITLRTLSNGTYSDCTITVKNTLGNSATLNISTFVVDAPTWYDLNGITFGNNTFVAVGDKGAVLTSSDNGSSWDNGTSGTTKELNEIAYGNSTFVSVGQSGTHLYSRDDGTSWSTGTWSETGHITGVAFGKNTFIGVSSTFLTKSTDNGSIWEQECSGMRVYDVAFGNSKFVGSGAEGAIGIYDNDSETTCSLGSSNTTTHTLYGITFGNNQFFSVGSSGKLIISSDNGSNFTNVTTPVTKSLYSIVFGNNIFVAVGSRTVVVSNNDGSSVTGGNTVTFKDVTFGNGVFVAVGYKIIYTSTDGVTWTQVYGE